MILPSWGPNDADGASLTLTQTLTGLSTTSNLYGLTFAYKVSMRTTTCTLVVTLGTSTLFSQTYTSAYRNSNSYKLAKIDFVTPPSSTADLTLAWTCANSHDGSRVYLDDVFFTSGTYSS